MDFFPICQTEVKGFGDAPRNLRKNIPIVPSNIPQDAKNQTALGSSWCAFHAGTFRSDILSFSAFIFLIQVSWFYGTLNLLKHLHFCKQKSLHLNSLETSENTHLKYPQLCHHQTFEITLPVPANHLEISHNSLKIWKHTREILLDYFTACSWSNPGIFIYLPNSALYWEDSASFLNRLCPILWQSKTLSVQLVLHHGKMKTDMTATRFISRRDSAQQRTNSKKRVMLMLIFH